LDALSGRRIAKEHKVARRLQAGTFGLYIYHYDPAASFGGYRRGIWERIGRGHALELTRNSKRIWVQSRVG